MKIGKIPLSRGLLLLLPTFMFNVDQIDVKVVDKPPTSGGNKFYVSNRKPLLSSPLIKLPIGSIKPEGWLRHQLELMAEGFTGNLTEISQWCKSEGNAWTSAHGEGQYGWEELPYWLRGFIDLGYILKDERIINESRRWVDAVLSSQDKDGYFGPRANKKNHDIWPNMVMLYVLRSYYEATDDARVPGFMARYFRWLNTLPFEQFLSIDQQKWRQGDYYPFSAIPRYSHKIWQWWRGGENLDHIYWLYNRTGDKWLLDLARINHERTADWTSGIPTWHGVNLTMGFREPAQYYQQTHDIRYLRATERNYDSIMTTFGQVPGGMFGADENARDGYTGPRQAAETCSMVEFMHSFEMLLKITGDPIWGDRCEEVAFNSLPASMTPDLKGLHYLTAPNMVQLDTADKSPFFDNPGDMLSYSPWRYRCCQHNVAFGWPYFAEHLWMATQRNGLAAVFYAPSEVKAKVGNGIEVSITEATDYPFDEVIEFKISTEKPVQFPFLLRVPGWCQNAQIQVNGEYLNVNAKPLSWIVLEPGAGGWNNGDIVRLVLPMEIHVKKWARNHDGISVYRGPLAYSLKIGERWERYGGTDKWPEFQVFPTTPWNYGLLIDSKNPVRSFEVVKKSPRASSQPFSPDNAPVELHAKGKRIPQWKLQPNGLVGEIQPRLDGVRSDEPVDDITLIPMGCARLRISVFPQIGENSNGDVWK
ncbi:MAG: beta-L-arabinofuranosidase domain-containing protein [Bacteroidota bacterium]